MKSRGIRFIGLAITDAIQNNSKIIKVDPFSLFTPFKVERMKSRGIRFIGLGVTDAVDEEQMLEIVSNPEDYFRADDFEELQAELDGIITEVWPREWTSLFFAMQKL